MRNFILFHSCPPSSARRSPDRLCPSRRPRSASQTLQLPSPRQAIKYCSILLKSLPSPSTSRHPYLCICSIQTTPWIARCKVINIHSGQDAHVASDAHHRSLQYYIHIHTPSTINRDVLVISALASASYTHTEREIHSLYLSDPLRTNHTGYRQGNMLSIQCG